MAATITSITGLQNLPNLEAFYADWNSLASVDLSGLDQLTTVDISDNEFPDSNTNSLTEVNLSGCTALDTLRLDDSDFSSGIPDFSDSVDLTFFDLDGCSISGSVDLTGFPILDGFDLSSNPDITEVIISSSQPLIDVNINGCSLTQSAVDDILVALSENSIDAGNVNLASGSNWYPSSVGESALDVLDSKGWTWNVNSAPGDHVGIAASSDFNISGDFTIEMFVNMNDLSFYPRPYSFGTYPAANAISIEGGAIYFWANNQQFISGSFSPNIGQWYHICVMGSSSNAYIFVDGAPVASATYEGSISSQNLPLTIGYGNEANSEFNGLMSNFRWSNNAIYSTSGFSVPTSAFIPTVNTVLLIFQGDNLSDQLIDNSGNGHNATNLGATYSASSPFVGDVGSLQMGTI